LQFIEQFMLYAAIQVGNFRLVPIVIELLDAETDAHDFDLACALSVHFQDEPDFAVLLLANLQLWLGQLLLSENDGVRTTACHLITLPEYFPSSPHQREFT
jgi:hypothetical protein